MSDVPNWSTGYSGTFGYFAFYNNKLYFPNNTNILETNLDDGTHTVWASSDTGVYGFGCIVYDGDLYLTDGGAGKIYKMSLLTPNIIETFITLYATQAIVEYGGYFYISNYNGIISKILISDPTGASSIINWATTTSGSSPLAITSEYLYVGFDGTNNQYICRIKLSDGSVNMTWVRLPSGFPGGLAIQDNYLYATNAYSTTSIYRVTLTDTPIITEWKTDMIPTTRGIGYNNNYLYVYSDA